MSNKDQAPFDIPDPEAAGWKEDPDRPGYWLWENEHPVNEAPDDGKQYGRQSSPAGTTPTWTEIVATSWTPSGGGINTNASKVIVGTEGTEGVGLYANGSLRVWETAQNNNYLWTGYGGASITSHIQADGDAKFSGTVDCGAVGRLGFASFGFSANVVYGRGSNNVAGGVDLGTDAMRWANGYFSGAVNASTAYIKAGSLDGRNGSQFGSNGGFVQLNNTFTHFEPSVHNQCNIGSAEHNFKGGYFSGTVTANAFVGDGSQLTGIDIPDVDLTGYATQTWVTSGFQPKGSYLTSADLSGYATQTWVNNKGYLTSASLSGYATQTWVNQQGFAKGTFVPTSGNTQITGTLTATDFVATSDRRVKKNIATAPTGVIEKIRGVEFEWKATGQIGSGVIAQELESVPELAHLVHYGEEDGTKHVSYLGLIGYLIEEVKSLRAEIEGLK